VPWTMFAHNPAASRQPTLPPQQSARRRPQNLRQNSPGPGPSTNAPGASLFTSATGSGKAPAQYQQRDRDREQLLQQQYQQQQTATQGVVMELSEEQKEEINEAFGLFDLNKDRKIDYHELKVAMKALGFDLPKPELLAILREHGVLANGQAPPAAQAAQPSNLYITQEEFTVIMTQKILDRDPLEEITRAFELFAGISGRSGQAGHDARIGVDDLRRVAKELGETLEEEELRAMIDEFDIDNDGMISREEFIAICRGE